MIDVYRRINDRLDTINFNEIINGFRPCSFALFDEERAVIDCMTIDKPKQFVANTVADYKGALVATYYYDFLPKNLDRATALIVHEMYHAFQFGEMDYKKSLMNTSEKNGMFYDYTVETLTLKYTELMCLIDAYLNKSEEDYGRFLWVRKLRKDKFPKALHYEQATEFIEGSATYAELKALEQLDTNLFKEAVSQAIDALRNVESYFFIRELSYKVGALMFLTLDALTIDFDKVIEGHSFIDECYICDDLEVEIKSKLEIKDLVEKKTMENKAFIDAFFSKDYCKIDFDEVIAYNPMGVIRCEDKLLVKFLVVIKVAGKEETLRGDFCLGFDDNKECVQLYMLK